MTGSPSAGGEHPLSGTEARIEFQPGDEFSGPVEHGWLLTRLRLSPSAVPFDLEQGSLHVWLNGELLDIDDTETVLDSDGESAFLISASAAEAGGSVSRIGDWLVETWPEVSNVITRVPAGFDDVAYALAWAAEVVGGWIDDERDVDIDVDSPLLSVDNAGHRAALLEAGGESSYLVALNGRVIDSPEFDVDKGAGTDAR